MSRGSRVELAVGERILFPGGPRLITAVTPMGYVTRDVYNREEQVSWAEIEPARRVLEGRVDAVATSVAAVFAGLSEEAQQQALDRQEVVLAIGTGYAHGHPALKRPGEPFTAFDPKNGLSLAKRFEAMARQLEQEAAADRRAIRGREAGEPGAMGRLEAPSASSVRLWYKTYFADVDGGLFALVDGRRKRSHTAFDSLEPAILRICDETVAQFDGTRSVLSVDEVVRQVKLQIKAEGLYELPVPGATGRKYLSHQLKQRGSTTRSHLTTNLRGPMSVSAYPALRPGQVVAVDVTRADNFVVEPWSGKGISVEIITALDVCTRVVLAVRVVPRSARSIEAGLILYDVLRPFSQAVERDQLQDWRWAGVPEHLGPMDEALAKAEELSSRPLLGEHAVPGVLPEAIRADHGSIFTSQYFRALCDRLDIHLLLSRGKKPTDNAFVERWHETLQRCLQQLTGHKGRNVAQRGSKAGLITRDENDAPYFQGDGPALTPRQLEVRLREFITTDYHRTPHGGISIVDREMPADEAWMSHTPLECFDAMLEATGRLHVLQRPDLLYDFLPIRWGTIRHDGVEFHDLTYDCRELDEFRDVPQGFFRDQDRAAPFFFDERDMSRVWFRHPHTDQIIEVPWRRAFQLHAPMTKVTFERARSLARENPPGQRPRNSLELEILEAINDIADIDRIRANTDLLDWNPGTLAAAHMRYGRSGFDHAEARDAVDTGSRSTKSASQPDENRVIAFESGPTEDFDEPWPDYLGLDD